MSTDSDSKKNLPPRKPINNSRGGRPDETQIGEDPPSRGGGPEEHKPQGNKPQKSDK